ncbi:MAG: hypothetical protein WCK86_11605 [Planctomycetia bacterium]
MANDWDTSTCNEKSGFLFRHACYQIPNGKCSACQKPVCLDHSHQVAEQLMCTTCAKRGRQQTEEQRSGPYVQGRDYHDPYFYGDYYGYRHYYDRHSVNDPYDFTAADAENLKGTAEEGFENDMSES